MRRAPILIGLLLIISGAVQAAVFPLETPSILFAAGFTDQSVSPNNMPWLLPPAWR